MGRAVVRSSRLRPTHAGLRTDRRTEITETFKTKGGEIYLQREILDKIEAILEAIPKERGFGIKGEMGVYEIRSIPLSLVQKVKEAVLDCTEYPGGITLEEVE